MQIILTPEESINFFYNALCIGLGYIGGYGLKIDYSKDAYASARKGLQEPCFEDVLIQILKDGGILTFVDIENDGEYTKHIIMQDVVDRVAKTPADHLLDEINEEGDATTADVILQTVAFGEVIFG